MTCSRRKLKMNSPKGNESQLGREKRKPKSARDQHQTSHTLKRSVEPISRHRQSFSVTGPLAILGGEGTRVDEASAAASRGSVFRVVFGNERTSSLCATKFSALSVIWRSSTVVGSWKLCHVISSSIRRRVSSMSSRIFCFSSEKSFRNSSTTSST